MSNQPGVRRQGRIPIVRKKTLWVTGHGCRPPFLSESACDDPWIFVRGSDSVCLVTNRMNLTDDTLSALACGLSANFCPTTYFFPLNLLDPDQLQPFAKVTYAETYFGPQFPGISNAQSYLQDRLKNVTTLSHEQTVQIALTAWCYMEKRAVESNEIKVYTVGQGMSFDRALTEEEIRTSLTNVWVGNFEKYPEDW